ncbi:hypothetical protein H5972_08830 [Ligilactobacillus salivarius]|uniref:hypothetical protein n=1 Tax=Ligilactobacillus salivarius TaxID=1624 RepID=UPI00195E1749|nr:hypothetical protein [Ligilactobacillus salivarius]MBM6957352.1 hypothetical protein [Ligilactobacillus salivarius]
MIVELFGAPGSGKTTLCNKIEDDVGIKNILEIYRKKTLYKAYMHVFWKTFFFRGDIKDKYNKIQKILDENEDTTMLVKFMLFTYFIEKKYQKKKLIIDEGCIHFLVALYAEYNIDFKRLEEIKNILCISNVKVLGINTKKKYIINNVKKRSRNKTRIDKLDGDEFSKLIDRYIEGVNYFGNYYPTYGAKEAEIEIKKILIEED